MAEFTTDAVKLIKCDVDRLKKLIQTIIGPPPPTTSPPPTPAMAVVDRVFCPSISVIADTGQTCVAFRVCIERRKKTEMAPTIYKKFWFNLVSIAFGFNDASSLFDGRRRTLKFNNDGGDGCDAPLSPSSPSWFAAPDPDDDPLFHAGIEDVRTFFRRQQMPGCNPVAYAIGNVGMPRSGGERNMVIIGPDGLHPRIKSPIVGKRFEKNWMPVIGRDGCIMEPAPGFGLFLYAFAPSTFISVPIDRDDDASDGGGGGVKIVASLTPTTPDNLNDQHLCTQLAWSNALAGYVCAFHSAYNWASFAFAVFNPDGPDGFPGSRRGITQQLTIPNSVVVGSRDWLGCVPVCYPTSISQSSSLSDDGQMIIGVSIANRDFAFASFDPRSLVLLDNTSANSPWK